MEEHIMKFYYKFTTILLIAVISMCCASCGETQGDNNSDSSSEVETSATPADVADASTPEEAVSIALDYLKANNSDSFVAMCVNEDGSAVENNAFLQVASSNLDYKINSSTKVDDDNYIVNTDITNIDIVSIYFYSAKATLQIQAMQSTEELTDQDIVNALNQAILSNKPEPSTINTDVKVTKVNGSWKVVSDLAFNNAVLGSVSESGTEVTTQ